MLANSGLADRGLVQNEGVPGQCEHSPRFKTGLGCHRMDWVLAEGIVLLQSERDRETERERGRERESCEPQAASHNASRLS